MSEVTQVESHPVHRHYRRDGDIISIQEKLKGGPEYAPYKIFFTPTKPINRRIHT